MSFGSKTTQPRLLWSTSPYRRRWQFHVWYATQLQPVYELDSIYQVQKVLMKNIMNMQRRHIAFSRRYASINIKDVRTSSIWNILRQPKSDDVKQTLDNQETNEDCVIELLILRSEYDMVLGCKWNIDQLSMNS